jgi:hypothetical protein
LRWRRRGGGGAEEDEKLADSNVSAAPAGAGNRAGALSDPFAGTPVAGIDEHRSILSPLMGEVFNIGTYMRFVYPVFRKYEVQINNLLSSYRLTPELRKRLKTSQRIIAYVCNMGGVKVSNSDRLTFLLRAVTIVHFTINDANSYVRSGQEAAVAKAEDDPLIINDSDEDE